MIAYIRVVDGTFRKGETIIGMQTGTQAEHRRHRLLHARISRRPRRSRAGEVGYLITGIKDVSQLRVGDTLTTKNHRATEPLPGYRDVKPMVFCGLFPMNNDDYPELRDALEKLTLNDAALMLGARRPPTRSASASAAASSACCTWTSSASASSASTTSS